MNSSHSAIPILSPALAVAGVAALVAVVVFVAGGAALLPLPVVTSVLAHPSNKSELTKHTAIRIVFNIFGSPEVPTGRSIRNEAQGGLIKNGRAAAIIYEATVACHHYPNKPPPKHPSVRPTFKLRPR